MCRHYPVDGWRCTRSATDEDLRIMWSSLPSGECGAIISGRITIIIISMWRSRSVVSSHDCKRAVDVTSRRSHFLSVFIAGLRQSQQYAHTAINHFTDHNQQCFRPLWWWWLLLLLLLVMMMTSGRTFAAWIQKRRFGTKCKWQKILNPYQMSITYESLKAIQIKRLLHMSERHLSRSLPSHRWPHAAGIPHHLG